MFPRLECTKKNQPNYDNRDIYRILSHSKAVIPAHTPAAIPRIFHPFSVPVLYLFQLQYPIAPRQSKFTVPIPPYTTTSLSFFDNFLRPFNFSFNPPFSSLSSS